MTVPRRRAVAAAKPTSAAVAIGASAGGLESVGRLLEGLPENFPAPILVAMHLDPHHRSQAVPLLQRRTKLRVQTARPGIQVQPGIVYVAPPDLHLELHGKTLNLNHTPRVNYSRPSIDVLFASVAAACGPAAIGVILSGTGHDGAAGLATVKGRGGMAVAEDATTAAFPGMPAEAARTGLLDAILPVGQIPAFLVRALARRVTVSALQWKKLMARLEAHTGAKFTKYRPATLHRRLQQRLAARGCVTMAEYLRLVAENDAELDLLQAAFLIKVSAFHRDAASWQSLAKELEPSAAQQDELRAWSAGCATGEEAYTLALLLAHHFGDGPHAKWKVFATDLDEGALKVARAGKYSDEKVRGVRRADLTNYFVREDGFWRVGKTLRSRVVFGRHDLLRDPPLPDIDILACRNVLIYFRPEDKGRTLHQLASVVEPGGILFLGRSEALETVPGFDRIGHTTLFRRKRVRTAMTKARKPSAARKPKVAAASVGQLLSDSPAIVAIAVDAKNNVLAWNRGAHEFFGISSEEAVGKALAKSVGVEPAKELKSAAKGGGIGQTVAIEFEAVDGPRVLDVECLMGTPPAAALFLGTEARQKAIEPARARPMVSLRGRTASTEDRLHAQQDLTAELQSRNEELETVNEELQSLNDEMSAMEAQMRGLGEDSHRNNEFLRLLLDTSSDVLVACDGDNRVSFWNKTAVKKFRLSSAQAVGGDLFDLVPALDVAPVRAAAKKVRQPGRGGRVMLTHDGTEFVFDPLRSETGTRRSYLLRVRAAI